MFALKSSVQRLTKTAAAACTAYSLNIWQEKAKKGIEGADSIRGHSDQSAFWMSSRLTPLGHLKKILRKDKNHNDDC